MVPKVIDVLFTAISVVAAVWIYIDATNNKIGKIPGRKSFFFNISAGRWAAQSLILWFIGIPMYLVKRGELIALAKENPVEVSNRGGKIALIAFIGAVLFGSSYWLNSLAIGVPGCADTATVQTAEAIISRAVKEKTGEDSIVQLGGIKTVSSDGGYKCSAFADFKFANGRTLSGQPLTYTSTRADDGTHIVAIE